MGLDKFQKTPCGFCFVEYVLSCSCRSCRSTRLCPTYVVFHQILHRRGHRSIDTLSERHALGRQSYQVRIFKLQTCNLVSSLCEPADEARCNGLFRSNREVRCDLYEPVPLAAFARVHHLSPCGCHDSLSSQASPLLHLRGTRCLPHSHPYPLPRTHIRRIA